MKKDKHKANLHVYLYDDGYSFSRTKTHSRRSMLENYNDISSHVQISHAVTPNKVHMC